MPECDLLESLLWDAIAQAGVEDDLRREFTITQPLWYGLWMNSPLTPLQCRILYRLFSEIEVNRYERACREEFLKALDTAYRHNLFLEVHVQPLGHMDFGWLEIYPHCPRCHAFAKMTSAYAKDYASELTCPVCNTVYDPRTTCSMTEAPPPRKMTFWENVRSFFAVLIMDIEMLFGGPPHKSPEQRFQEDYRLKRSHDKR